jgi:hypothetical protein
MTVSRHLLTINSSGQKPLFCPKNLARQALEPQLFRPEPLHLGLVSSTFSRASLLFALFLWKKSQQLDL